MKTNELLKKGIKEINQEHLAKKLLIEYLDIKEYKIPLNENISIFKVLKYKKGLKKIKKGIPIQYVIKESSFKDITLIVNKNVLIPRPETELLIEKTEGYIKRHFKGELGILDIGTGSGAIALSLKETFKYADILGVDISKKALKVARKNKNKLKININLLKSDLFNNIKNRKFDIIISNPPYLESDEKADNEYEPEIALYKGIEIYKKIIDKSLKYLNKKYLIAFEIGETQGKEIKEYSEKILKEAIVTIEKDLNNRDRYIFILKK